MNENKRELRINIMNQLYQYDLYQSEGFEFNPSFDIEEELMMFQAILVGIHEIDKMIETHLFDYSLYRLSYVDRAIIRLATYELLKTTTPKQVIINEAVELTKIYSNLDDEKQHKFTNRLLDTIAKAIKG